MKIFYFTNQYPAVSHTFIKREILELERRGHEIIRLTIRKSRDALVDPSDRDEEQRTLALLQTPPFTLLTGLIRTIIFKPVCFFSALITMLRLNKVNDRSLLTHLAYLAEAVLLSDLCKTYQIRHIHTHFGTNSAAVALLSKILCGVTYSLTIHGPEEFDGPVALSLREKVGAASFVIAISHFAKAQLQRWTDPKDWNKIHVVRCTVDDVFFQEAQPIPLNAVSIICVGRLSAQKGQFVLIEAFARVVNSGKNIKLILAGDGELRPAIEQSILEHQLKEHVEITGWISGNRVRHLLRSVRGLVLPSFAEGLPVVIMEAMAMGRPVISTFVAGIPELVHDGTNGWLVPAGDVDALVDAINRIADTSVEQLNTMGQCGISAAYENHLLRTEIAKLEYYLKEMC